MERKLIELVWERAGSCCGYCRMPQEHDEERRAGSAGRDR
jgi:hypothetical protein